MLSNCLERYCCPLQSSNNFTKLLFPSSGQVGCVYLWNKIMLEQTSLLSLDQILNIYFALEPSNLGKFALKLDNSVA